LKTLNFWQPGLEMGQFKNKNWIQMTVRTVQSNFNLIQVMSKTRWRIRDTKYNRQAWVKFLCIARAQHRSLERIRSMHKIHSTLINFKKMRSNMGQHKQDHQIRMKILKRMKEMMNKVESYMVIAQQSTQKKNKV
jgi:hypothetical protein